MFTKCFSFRSFMPTDSNESSTSSVTALVVPLMSTSITNTSATITTSSLSSIRTPTPTRPNSPVQQIDKLKRFLSTLYYFGSDISNETGERVRALILALVVSFALFSISILWILNRMRTRPDGFLSFRFDVRKAREGNSFIIIIKK
jgi:hypothetical protein